MSKKITLENSIIIDKFIIHQDNENSKVICIPLDMLGELNYDTTYLPFLETINLRCRFSEMKLIQILCGYLEPSGFILGVDLDFGIRNNLYALLNFIYNEKIQQKINEMNLIKRDLLETSAKINMNPSRIQRLIENGDIDIENIETFYHI